MEKLVWWVVVVVVVCRQTPITQLEFELLMSLSICCSSGKMTISDT